MSIYTPPEDGKDPQEYAIWCRLHKAASTTAVVPVRGIRRPTPAQIDIVHRFAWDVHDTGTNLSARAAEHVLNQVFDVPEQPASERRG